MKIAVLPTPTNQFNVIHLQTTILYFTKIWEKIVLNFIWKQKNLSQNKPEQQKSCGYFIFPDFKIFYKVVEIKAGWYWHTNKYIDWCNRIESSQINSYSYCHVTFDKKTNLILEESNHFSTNTGQIGQLHVEEWPFILSFTLHKI